VVAILFQDMASCHSKVVPPDVERLSPAVAVVVDAGLDSKTLSLINKLETLELLKVCRQDSQLLLLFLAKDLLLRPPLRRLHLRCRRI
jgi:hypothetical protein